MNTQDYFKSVKTFEDYHNLQTTGMMYELFPDAPATWFEHTKQKLEYDYEVWGQQLDEMRKENRNGME